MPAIILFDATEDDMRNRGAHHALANHFQTIHLIVANDIGDVRQALLLASPLIITGLHEQPLRGLPGCGYPPRLMSYDAGIAELLAALNDPQPYSVPEAASYQEQEPDFWLVWSPEGKGPPRYQHNTQEAAEREARRLSALNPGRQFFVLEPRFEITTATRGIVRYRRADDDEIPF